MAQFKRINQVSAAHVEGLADNGELRIELDHDDMAISLFISAIWDYNAEGIYQALTPAQARDFAAALVRAAEMVEEAEE